MALDQGVKWEDPWLTGTYWFECGINGKYANGCEVLGVIKLLMALEFLYAGCPGGNVPDLRRMFLKLKFTDITKNTYIRS